MKNTGKKGKSYGCGHEKSERKNDKDSFRKQRKERLKQKGKI